MHSLNLRILYVTGAASWKCWLPDFLQSRDFAALSLFAPESTSEITEAVREANVTAVVFLSHHDTLRRDVDWAEELKRRCGVPALTQSALNAELAHDKRLMGRMAGYVPDVSSLPELSPRHVAECLSDGTGGPFVRKLASGTEGRNLSVLTRAGDLPFSSELDFSPGLYLYQPFLSGEEYSVNVAVANGCCVTYEPVYKGITRLDGLHPSKRVRRCPSTDLSPQSNATMRDAAARISVVAQMSGVVEFEFLLVEGRVYLLEINPRLAATMRMSSLACDDSIFSTLGRLLLLPSPERTDLKATMYTREFPLPGGAGSFRDAGRMEPDVWITSRVTVRGRTEDEVDRRCMVLQGEFANAKEGDD